MQSSTCWHNKLQYVAEKVSVLRTYALPVSTILLYIHPLTPCSWSIRNTCIHSRTLVGKLWAWRCQSQECLAFCLESQTYLCPQSFEVFSLLYEVFGVVRVLFLRVLHFFRLWSCLQWCFPITWNRWYVTVNGWERTTNKLRAAWLKNDAKPLMLAILCRWYEKSGTMTRNPGCTGFFFPALTWTTSNFFRAISNVLTLVRSYGQPTLHSITSHCLCLFIHYSKMAATELMMAFLCFAMMCWG